MALAEGQESGQSGDGAGAGLLREMMIATSLPNFQFVLKMEGTNGSEGRS
jgi:hypothetical protein